MSLRPLRSGVLVVAPLAAGSVVSVELVPFDLEGDGEAWLTFEARLVSSTDWAEAGHVLALGQRVKVDQSGVRPVAGKLVDEARPAERAAEPGPGEIFGP